MINITTSNKDTITIKESHDIFGQKHVQMLQKKFSVLASESLPFVIQG